MTKEELEKEAEEWLCNNLHSASEEDFIKAMVDIAESREKRIAELKEELKDANEKVVHLACNQNKDLKRKINKAKEIIKNLMVFAEMDDREYEKEYKEAEQFLSEVERYGFTSLYKKL